MNKAENESLDKLLRALALETAPKLEFMAVHKETGEEGAVVVMQFFNAGGLNWVTVWTGDSDHPCAKTWNASECHLCQSTGYKDSEGEKVFRGHLWRIYNGDQSEHEDFVIEWEQDQGWWVRRWLHEPSDISPFTAKQACLGTNIGHIHQPSGWSDEVRRLLE